MKKRGQIDSHILVYMLTIVIVAGIIVMGYRFISKSSKVMDKGELIQFRNKLAFDIKSIGNDYGTFKKITYTLPRNLQEVCFVDVSKKDDVLSSKLIDFYPVIKDVLNSNLSKNIFFVGLSDEQSFYMPDIAISHYPFMNCFHQKNGKIDIGIEGLGGGNSQILADFLTKVKISKDDKTILQSADEVIILEIPKGTTVNTDYISIEMVEPTIANKNLGASDVYKFGPSGTSFSSPIELRIKFNPKITGNCPSKLIFSQFSEDGSNKVSIGSKSIDCKNNIALFEINRFI